MDINNFDLRNLLAPSVMENLGTNLKHLWGYMKDPKGIIWAIAPNFITRIKGLNVIDWPNEMCFFDLYRNQFSQDYRYNTSIETFDGFFETFPAGAKVGFLYPNLISRLTSIKGIDRIKYRVIFSQRMFGQGEIPICFTENVNGKISAKIKGTLIFADSNYLSGDEPIELGVPYIATNLKESNNGYSVSVVKHGGAWAFGMVNSNGLWDPEIYFTTDIFEKMDTSLIEYTNNATYFDDLAQKSSHFCLIALSGILKAHQLVMSDVIELYNPIMSEESSAILRHDGTQATVGIAGPWISIFKSSNQKIGIEVSSCVGQLDQTMGMQRR